MPPNRAAVLSQRSNASLAGSCAPPEGMVPEPLERRRERHPEAF